MSLLNVGVSALTANQAALQTIGHNIANVNSPGYSRQTVALQTVAGQNRGNGYIGNGVSVATVMRNYSELLNKQSNAANAASAADAARSSSLTQMQDTFAGGNSGLGAAITNMMNAFADLETSPMDSSARNVVLTRISELASRFRAASTSLEEQDYTTKQQITNGVTLVNSLATQVATLNTQITRALATGHSPNDLLDQRDQVIREINQHVKTTQVPADDGSINLFVSGSQALVLGSNSAQLSVSESTNYPNSGKLSLYFSQPGGEQVELTAGMVAGGEVAGLLKFNNDDLVEGRNLLGRLALAIGTELNNQNKLGLTLSGAPGTDLFKLPTSMPGYSNITNYTLGNPPSVPPSASVTFADTHALVASDYQIVFGATAADTKIVRLSDGKTRSLVGDLGVANPLPTPTTFTVDGLTFSLDANAIAGTQGQSILFKPFGTAANDIKALVYTPDDLAVANPASAAIPAENKGTLQLAKLQAVSQAGLPAKNHPFTIQFALDPQGKTVYSVLDDTGAPVNDSNGAPMTGLDYQSGKPLTILGLSITLNGTPHPGDPSATPPVPGDRVVISNAQDDALGDSWKRNAGNATAFLDLRDAKIFDNGTTLTDGYSSAMAVVGTRTQSAQYAAELSASVAASLEGERTSVSGVNLDEEAARLLQFQQSYQASAKVIQIAQSLFDSVLSAVNR